MWSSRHHAFLLLLALCFYFCLFCHLKGSGRLCSLGHTEKSLGVILSFFQIGWRSESTCAQRRPLYQKIGSDVRISLYFSFRAAFRTEILDRLPPNIPSPLRMNHIFPLAPPAGRNRVRIGLIGQVCCTHIRNSSALDCIALWLLT